MRFSGAGGTVADPGVPSPPRAGTHDLRGLLRIVEYVRKGGELAPLYVGKIAAVHIPLIEELRWRKVLRPLPLRPRLLDRDDSLQRLNEI